MSTEERARGALGRHILPGLLARVIRARSLEQGELREQGARPEHIRAARLDTLIALRDYADALEDLSWPVPRTVLLEIQLHEALIGPLSARRSSEPRPDLP